MMAIADVDRITKVLDAMIQYEISLSSLYENCAEIWKENGEFWRDLSQAEIGHAENIKKMMEILAKKPERFEMGRPFNLMALSTALTGVKDKIKRVSEKGFSLEKMLILARDIEQSILESHYGEIVKTDDGEYLNLMKNILSQTYDHRMMLQKKMDESRSKP
jgi:hypothetical protein